MNQFNDIIAKYKQTKGINQLNITTALIDMDGVLYDSMKYHTIAWKKLTDELNIEASLDEFYIYEGMTGAGIIRLLFKRSFNEEVSDEKAAELYAIKAKYFGEVGKVEVMPDAQRMTSILRDNNIERVLVTGSGQASILNCLDTDYAGIFDHDKRVTAHDVTNCKPHPEPYLRG
ncbi:MAG: HAD hydrolase-like protein, partial [Muribaculaceae bacterium]|nr:HAD hydrolase-like protein [Muribaculaceae bacterium]